MHGDNLFKYERVLSLQKFYHYIVRVYAFTCICNYIFALHFIILLFTYRSFLIPSFRYVGLHDIKTKYHLLQFKLSISVLYKRKLFLRAS
jgi:hypothetical protein